METKFIMTKWCKCITDDKKDWYVNKDKRTEDLKYKFRILDDDDVVYGYGLCNKNDSFAPVSRYQSDYGVTGIQYKNCDTGKYEFL